MQTLDPYRTTWHITFGTYGTRLHGGFAATVDKRHNQRGEPFVATSVERERVAKAKMKFPEVRLSSEQRRYTETSLPEICERGGWQYRIAAAQSDHVHVLCDVKREIHDESYLNNAYHYILRQRNTPQSQT